MDNPGFLIATQPVTGVILAGGLGRRMGQVDKGLQLLNGRPMAAWIAERIAPQVDTLLINANRNHPSYERLGYRIVADAIPDFAGPLAGLHAALSAADTPLVATVPCDSPFLPHDLVARLKQALAHADAEIAIAMTGEQAHPVFCLCRRGVLANLSDYLASGQRKFETWYHGLKGVSVSFNDNADAFENINTPADLARFTTPAA